VPFVEGNSEAAASDSAIATDEDRRALVRFVEFLVIASACAIWLAAILNVRPLLSANDRSRWCTVWSLVERGTYQIDEISRKRGWDTIDKVYHEEHFYSSKPALYPTLVAGVYWVVKQITGWDLAEQTVATVRLILCLINLLPMVAALLVLSRLLNRYAQTDATRVFVLVVAAFGTMLTPFIVTLNNHTPAAVGVLLALYPAMRIVADGVEGPSYFALSGFLAAFACTNELPAALFGLALFGLLLLKSPTRTLTWFVPAALIPLCGFFITTYLCTGGWKPFYMYFGTEKYLYVVDGVRSYWLDPQGIDKGGDSALVYLLHCTLGHHGIFSLSPVFLLTLAAWLQPRTWRDRPLGLFVWMGALLSAAILVFYLTRTANYNYGGNTSGLRWMFWLIPFWLVAIIPIFDSLGRRRWFRLLAALLLFVSAFSAFRPINNPWRPPWLFELMDVWGWISY